MIESEEKRYPMMLDIFTTYYRAKEESDRFIRRAVDRLIDKAQLLSHMIL